MLLIGIGCQKRGFFFPWLLISGANIILFSILPLLTGSLRLEVVVPSTVITLIIAVHFWWVVFQVCRTTKPETFTDLELQEAISSGRRIPGAPLPGGIPTARRAAQRYVDAQQVTGYSFSHPGYSAIPGYPNQPGVGYVYPPQQQPQQIQQQPQPQPQQFPVSYQPVPTSGYMPSAPSFQNLDNSTAKIVYANTKNY